MIIPVLLLLLVACDESPPSEASAYEPKPMKITYLKKANDHVVSFCSCGDGRMSFPAQMDCPWCGCGWLFTCVTCGKAFTFAQGVEIESTWEDVARKDIQNKWGKEPPDEDIASWIEAMKEILSDVRPGGRYVIIDGSVISEDAKNITFDGWHAHHEFADLPQVQARVEKSALDAQLGNRDYWKINALPKD